MEQNIQRIDYELSKPKHISSQPDKEVKAKEIRIKEKQALQKKLANQKKELAFLYDVIKRRNLALDALNYVWCSGGCEGGWNRLGDDKELTEEIVREAEKNTKRLREYYENMKFKKQKK